MWMLNFKQNVSTDTEDSQALVGILPVLKL